MGRTTLPIPIAVIYDPERGFLLVNKIKAITKMCEGRWQFPGGTMEFGDDFHTALKKKIREYLGVGVEPKGMLGNVVSKISERDGITYQFLVMPVECELRSEDFILSEGKIRDAQWFTFDEVRQLDEGSLLAEGDLKVAEFFLENNIGK